jgi:cytochrome b561
MGAAAGRLAERLHLPVALLSVWLLLTSPWVHMYRRIPRDASLLEQAHVAIGLALLPLGLAFFYGCCRAGQWRIYFPWLAGRFGQVGAELGGLMRGRLPAAEGGGLFAFIEGLLLLALLATAVSGAAWYAAQGGSAAPDWRDYHIIMARCMIGLLLLHVAAALLHLVDFIRE